MRTTLTTLEAQTIRGILHSEFGEGTVGRCTWTSSIGQNGGPCGKTLSGAMSSLVKKGCIEVKDYEGKNAARDLTVTLLEAGYENYTAFVAQSGEPAGWVPMPVGPSPEAAALMAKLETADREYTFKFTLTHAQMTELAALAMTEGVSMNEMGKRAVVALLAAAPKRPATETV